MAKHCSRHEGQLSESYHTLGTRMTPWVKVCCDFKDLCGRSYTISPVEKGDSHVTKQANETL